MFRSVDIHVRTNIRVMYFSMFGIYTLKNENQRKKIWLFPSDWFWLGNRKSYSKYENKADSFFIQSPPVACNEQWRCWFLHVENKTRRVYVSIGQVQLWKDKL